MTDCIQSEFQSLCSKIVSITIKSIDILGHEDSVIELIQSGVNVSATNEVGETALHAATLNGNKRIIDLLIQNGANVKVANIDGDTVLHLAAQNGNSKSSFFFK